MTCADRETLARPRAPCPPSPCFMRTGAAPFGYLSDLTNSIFASLSFTYCFLCDITVCRAPWFVTSHKKQYVNTAFFLQGGRAGRALSCGSAFARNHYICFCSYFSTSLKLAAPPKKHARLPHQKKTILLSIFSGLSLLVFGKVCFWQLQGHAPGASKNSQFKNIKACRWPSFFPPSPRRYLSSVRTGSFLRHSWLDR